MQKEENLKQTTRFNSELNIRKNKLKNLRIKNIAFPNKFKPKNLCKDINKKYNNQNKKELEILNVKISVAGRMISRSIMGKASFATLQDTSGKIQIYISKESLINKENNKNFKTWDIGDIIGVKGKLFKTKTMQLTIYCYKIYLLTKSLRPLPDKFHGLKDKESCYRQRYLDLITNQNSRNTFIMRSKIIYELRNFMIKNGFIEVETPMMQNIPGGANARPFITHHNSLNTTMYLRISPELYLKRLVIGGFEKIFEINKSFRNEGISNRHNPEFTMMELYTTYSTYKDLIKLIEKLFFYITKKIFKKTKIEYGKYFFDFKKPFIKMTMQESIAKHLNLSNINDLNDFDKTKKITNSLNIKTKKYWGLGKLIYEIFKTKIEKKIIQPTFITKYPTEISPLARSNDKNPFFSDRFELFISGYEIGNGFSELNDPEEQKCRFSAQTSMQQKHKKTKTMFYDTEYITALEYGLPPTAGLGIGIDRMIMLFTNKHTIKDVILFPTLRSSKN